MYPDWPESPADLVPLPLCDGPKLKPFDFQGSQKIKFLEHIGTGAHSQVFKIEILDRVYALKVFRFLEAEYVGRVTSSIGAYRDIDEPAVIHESNYSEPFNCECRAFGRLQETDNEDLANQCFGYILLDKEHEAAMMDKCTGMELNFGIYHNLFDTTGAMFPQKDRERFIGKSGRNPPFRCIVKAFGRKSEHDDLRTKDFRKLLRDMTKIQQLGIINLDVGVRQMIGGKLSDFSTAYTTPHYLLNPEINPHITIEQIPAIEYNIFAYSRCDFTRFDTMIDEWNDYASEDQKHKVSICALPGGNRIHARLPRYNLRSTPSRESIFTLVDTRQYYWAAPAIREQPAAATRTAGARRSGQKVERSGRGGGAVSKRTPRFPRANPPRWYYDSDSRTALGLRRATIDGQFSTELEWVFKGNLMFPKRGEWVDEEDDEDRAIPPGPECPMIPHLLT